MKPDFIVYSSHSDWINFFSLDPSLPVADTYCNHTFAQETYKMFVHMKYGNECGNRVMEFSTNHFITVNNVLEEARLTYGKCSVQ